MADKTSSADKEDCCKKETASQEKKLVKATELPIHGNPYPPKDTIVDERPGFLESKVGSVRTKLQPYTSPIGAAMERTSDVVSIGIAHSQSSIQRLAGQQNHVINVALIGASTLIGFAITKRLGFIKRLTVGSLFFGGTWAALYPDDISRQAQVIWYIGKNKLPVLAKEQYEKFTQSKTQDQNTEAKVVEKESKN